MISLVAQRGGYADCAIAAVATMAKVSYERSLAVCSRIDGASLTTGLSTHAIRKALKALGHTTHIKRHGAYDKHHATGILHVYKGRRANQTDESHVVVLWGGRVIDEGTECWMSLEEYLEAHPYKVGSLIVVDG